MKQKFLIQTEFIEYTDSIIKINKCKKLCCFGNMNCEDEDIPNLCENGYFKGEIVELVTDELVNPIKEKLHPKPKNI